MKKLNFLIMLTLASTMMTAQNPFFKQAKTPHETFPFNELKDEYYMPAFEEGIKQHQAEINKIANNKQLPTFENTIVAMERSGALLNKVATVFFALNGAETNDEMQEIAQKVSPLLTEHSTAINLNEKLFARVKAVYDQREKLNLSVEDAKLLEDTYEGFASNGANLPADKKEIFKQISKDLSLASVQFGQNVLKETNGYSLLITDKNVLAGMPNDFMEMTASKAKEAGKDGWLLNLRSTCYGPIMTYADNRDLRRELWMAYNTQCLPNSQYDNTQLIQRIINLQLQKANLLGYETYADYALRHRMAEKPSNVYKLLNDLMESYKPAAEKELKDVQDYANAHGAYFTIQPWDFGYYSEKLKPERFYVNDELLKPYFDLENVKQAVFG